MLTRSGKLSEAPRPKKAFRDKYTQQGSNFELTGAMQPNMSEGSDSKNEASTGPNLSPAPTNITPDALPPTPPDGGFDAWLRVFAAWLVLINTWGLTQTYGIFQENYEAIQLSGRSSSDISWIGSMQSFLVVLVGVVAGPLFDMGWLKPCLFIGSSLIVFGMMMLSLCQEYWQVFLAQGLVVGFGGGMLYIPAVALVTTQFTTKRPIAVGLASSGSSIGGIIYPLMFNNLQPSAGFGWAVRAIAFVIFGTLCIALVILGRHKQPRPAKQHTFKTLFAVTALKEPRFLAFTVSLFFIFLSFYIPLFYIPIYAQYSLKTSESLAYNLVPVVNAGSFFGRILPFLVKGLPPVYNLTFWTAVSALLLFCWIAIHNVPGFIVWTVLYGFASGVIISASPSVVAHKTLCPDLTNVSSRLGLSWAFAALDILIGTPIAGAGVNITRADFLVGQTVPGAMVAAGVLLLLIPTWAVFRYKEFA